MRPLRRYVRVPHRGLGILHLPETVTRAGGPRVGPVARHKVGTARLSPFKGWRFMPRFALFFFRFVTLLPTSSYVGRNALRCMLNGIATSAYHPPAFYIGKPLAETTGICLRLGSSLPLVVFTLYRTGLLQEDWFGVKEIIARCFPPLNGSIAMVCGGAAKWFDTTGGFLYWR